MPTYDDLWGKLGPLNTTGFSGQRTVPQDTDKKPDFDAMWDKVSNLGPTLNPLTQGKPKEDTSTLSDVGQSALAGGIRGVAALPGLPGDVAALGRYGLEQGKYYGLKAGEELNLADKGSAEAYKAQLQKERASPERDYVGFLPTSEATTKMAEEAFPAAKYEPKTVAGRFAKTTAEFLPSAAIPIGEAGLLARAGTAAASGVGSELAGTVTKGTALEPYARIAGAFAGPAGIAGAKSAIAPAVKAVTQPAESAIQTLGKVGQSDIAANIEGGRTTNQLLAQIEREQAAGIPPEKSVVKVADMFADSPAVILQRTLDPKALSNPEIQQKAQALIENFGQRAADNKTYLAQNINEITNPYTTSVVNRYRAAQGLEPIEGNVSSQQLKEMAQEIAATRNQAAYSGIYEAHPTVFNNTLNTVLNSPQGQRAAMVARDELNNSLVAKGQGDSVRSWVTMSKGRNGLPVVSMEKGLEGLPIEFWDRFGRELRSGPDSGITKGLMGQLDKGISEYFGGETNNPFTQARQTAATGFKEGNAFSAGSNIFSEAKNTLDPFKRDQFLNKFGNLGDEEKALYSAGVSQAIQSRIAQDGGLQFMNKFLANPENANVLKQALDWNLQKGAYSNFDRVKDAVDIANSYNKVNRINFIQQSDPVKQWFINHPVLTAAGGGSALELFYTLRDLNLIHTPMMIGSVMGGMALDKLRSIAANREAREILRILDSGDPELIRRVGQAVETTPSSRKAMEKVKDLLNIMDKKTQEFYAKAALTYAGGQARAIESKERMGMRKDGGRIHFSFGGELPYDENERMKRAEEQGFTHDLYHATQSPNEFKYFMPKAGPAAHELPGTHLGSLNAAHDRIEDYFGVSDWNAKKNQSNKWINESQAPSILPLKVKLEKGYVKKSGEPFSESELRSKVKKFAQSLKITRPVSSKEPQRAFARHLIEQGYDHVPYVNSIEDKGNISYLHLKPETHIRSKFAQFDPDLVGVKNLMANTGGRVEDNKTYYHVTNSENIPSIREKGILNHMPRNWKNLTNGKPYGKKGEIFAFTDYGDAVRWAHRQDASQTNKIGSGHVSIVSFKIPKEQKWVEDKADSNYRKENSGHWIKTVGKVLPSNIIEVTPIIVTNNHAYRTQRSTGGRIPDADRMFKSAKKYVDSRTKGLMNLHDDVIVNALRVAKSRGH